jgi:hypothetical protein
MPIIGQKLCFLFESDPAIGDVLEPRRYGESSESSLSCRKFTDELRRVKGRGITSGKTPGRAQVVWSSYSLDIYQLSTRGRADATGASLGVHMGMAVILPYKRNC